MRQDKALHLVSLHLHRVHIISFTSESLEHLKKTRGKRKSIAQTEHKFSKNYHLLRFHLKYLYLVNFCSYIISPAQQKSLQNLLVEVLVKHTTWLPPSTCSHAAVNLRAPEPEERPHTCALALTVPSWAPSSSTSYLPTDSPSAILFRSWLIEHSMARLPTHFKINQHLAATLPPLPSAFN